MESLVSMIGRHDQRVERRVEELLERMTPAEKAGQCCGTFVGRVGDVGQSLDDVFDQLDEYHLGFATPFGIASAPHTDPREVAAVANRLQQRAVEDSRLGIPLLIPVDATHGHAYVDGATVFPHNLGLAATWEPELAERVGQATARAVRATGAHQNYGPTCDVARDPRWGRVFETFGESSRLCGAMAAAKIRGTRQADDDVLTTAKHFPAYSQPERGEDAAPVDMSEPTLRQVFLPPFERAIEAGVDAVMPGYNAVNRVPAHGSERYLSELLREELEFRGLVSSDWGGVDQLHEDHRVTDSRSGSVQRAIGAGLDVVSIGGSAHARTLQEAVEAGAVSGDRLDDAVRRILRAKFCLGLFEDPYVDPDAAAKTVGRSDHEDLAYEAARKSTTLLKNDGILPLSGSEDVLLTGPNADDPHAQVGGWSVEDPGAVAGATIREAFNDAVEEGTVTFEPGTASAGGGDIDAAATAAANADVAVVALGEGWYIHEFAATDGGSTQDSFPSRLDLSLPESQQRLLRRVHETGTPVVLALVSGRPLAVQWAAENVSAMLWACYPGTQGGYALADVLLGVDDPGGRLPISVPRSTGHLPTLHDHLPHPKPAGEDNHPPSYDPLFAFGHGLSYAEFEYADLSVFPARTPVEGDVEAAVTVENVGDCVGEEVVTFYLSETSATRVRPVRELCGFERIRLAPGERRTVTVGFETDDLGPVSGNGRDVVESETLDIACADLTTVVELTAG